MFIAFEGPDGCGKTTLSKIYKDMKAAWWTKEPTFSSEEADRLNHITADSEREALFLMSRVNHQSDIRKNLKHNVVCDRYIWSALAYADTFTPSVFEFLKHAYNDKYFLTPDCYVFVNTPVEVCSSRKNEHSKQMLSNIWESYQYTKKYITCPIVEVEAVGDRDKVMEELLRKLGAINKSWGTEVIQECLPLYD